VYALYGLATDSGSGWLNILGTKVPPSKKSRRRRDTVPLVPSCSPDALLGHSTMQWENADYRFLYFDSQQEVESIFLEIGAELEIQPRGDAIIHRDHVIYIHHTSIYLPTSNRSVLYFQYGWSHARFKSVVIQYHSIACWLVQFCWIHAMIHHDCWTLGLAYSAVTANKA
jgi:hypothetical protein